MYHLTSSLRQKDPFETFAIASGYCKRFGISRVTETTRLDRIGIPVAAAIRPKAQKGSLIVTAGKGFHSIEAKTGALMEAIEFAFSEEQNSSLVTLHVPTARVLSSNSSLHTILDLCPIMDAKFTMDAPMSVVKMYDLLSKNEDFLPAELVFIPFQSTSNEPRRFGSHSNGLASGNTVEEACIHGIYEVLERDILSFEFIRQNSLLVEKQGLPDHANTIIRLVEEAGLEIVIKTVPNIFNLPFFKAYVLEKYAGNPTSISAGYGCHGNANIALIRAMVEAVQSRMSYIHGGREDLTLGYKEYADREGDHLQKFQNNYDSVKSAIGEINFHSVKLMAVQETSISDHLKWLLQWITKSTGIQQIFVGRHTQESDAIQVVKVIIPGMEFFNSETNRVGPRLRDFIQQQVS